MAISLTARLAALEIAAAKRRATPPPTPLAGEELARFRELVLRHSPGRDCTRELAALEDGTWLSHGGGDPRWDCARLGDDELDEAIVMSIRAAAGTGTDADRARCRELAVAAGVEAEEER